MKTKGYPHQLLALEASNRKRNYAFFFEQGLGKTWTILAEAEKYFLQGYIDCLLVIAPNGVHSNWVRREIPTHMSITNISYYWKGLTTKKNKVIFEKMFADHYVKEKVPLRIFSFNIDAVNTKIGYESIERTLKNFRTMIVIDESTRIKNHSAKRSIKTVELGKLGHIRRILSGTPLTRAPADLYMQFHFLKAGLLGTKSFRAFNAEFTVLLDHNDPEMQAILRKLGGKVFGTPQVAKKDASGKPMYKNLDKLMNLMKPHYFRATKKEFLKDLPPKIYKVIDFELTSKQRDIYDELKNEYNFLLKDNGMQENVTFERIAVLTKMKQITSGFIKVFDDTLLLDPKDNPRMNIFKDYVESVLEEEPKRKIIVWTMFKEEMNQIKNMFDEREIKSSIYNGDTPKEKREWMIDAFNEEGEDLQIFIGHAAAAGIGLTLTAADLTIYYSCSYDNELRKQSEDRNHRIGTTKSVLYVDFIAENTIDEEIQRSLANKDALANYVLGDK